MATIVAAAVFFVSVAMSAQEQSAAPQEQMVATQEQISGTQEQLVESPQRVVAAEEPAAAPVPETVADAAAPDPTALPAQEPAAAPAEEPVREAAQEETQAEEPPAEPEPAPVVEEPANVKFLDINDALPTRFFDAAGTAADAADPNRLVIALHADTDPTTWKGNDFRASTAAFSHLSAMDTISFRIEAPKGQRIAKVTYTQRGSGSAIRLGKAVGATHWVVGDYAAQLGVFTNPSLVGVADLSETPLASVDVSITTGLFAFAAPTSGSATIQVTSAEVIVELVPATDGF